MKYIIKKASTIALITALAITTTSCSENANANANANNNTTGFELIHTYDTTNATGTITLENNDVDIFGSGLNYKDDIITIYSSGTYVVQGTKENVQIYVDTTDEDVTIVLDGVNITNENDAPIFIKNANNTIIELPEGTTNILSDVASNIELTDETERDANATIYSKDDLTFTGLGTLIVNGNYKNAITSKDNLFIENGNFIITANNNAIIGKDSLTVNNGNFEIIAGNDGFHSDDTELGSILINDGYFNLVTKNDGIQAESTLQINDGTFNIKTNDGHSDAPVKVDDRGNGNMLMPMPMPNNGEHPPLNDNDSSMDPSKNMQFDKNSSTQKENNIPPITNDETDELNFDLSDEITTSHKGLKASNIIINGGNFTLDTYDDAVHSNNILLIQSGTFNIQAGDDAIHADNELTINGGEINITSSYEGIEAYKVYINDGNIIINATDDGINAAGASKDDNLAHIEINGGLIYIDAQADGLDSNGTIGIHGGEITINGSENYREHSIDADFYTRDITNGNIIAIDNNQSTFSNTSTQLSFVYSFGNTQNADNTIIITDKDGNKINSILATKTYSSVTVSSPLLMYGETYTITNGDITDTITLSIDETVTSNTPINDSMPTKGGRGQKSQAPTNQ